MGTPSASDVRAIITTALTDDQIDSIVADALLMVDIPCAAGWSDARQTAIVKWLTAHLIASRGAGAGEGALKSMSLGDASETYASAVTGKLLEGTPYGQQALALDTNGCLANLGKRRAYFKVL